MKLNILEFFKKKALDLKHSKPFLVLHWISFLVLVYIFGIVGAIPSLLMQPERVQDMKSIGFNTTWTILIGIGEILGVIGLLIGIKYRKLKTASAIFLFPFGVGATTNRLHKLYKIQADESYLQHL